ncbi:uncharacterized protein BROUX77_004074 [Berkeleyomyces rouxiae]|uniref:uncharacterized protein n=1 Tax=Berkeleyomyces rouxiae TaxID=2035830 RepID=UPI003B799D57
MQSKTRILRLPDGQAFMVTSKPSGFFFKHHQDQESTNGSFEWTVSITVGNESPPQMESPQYLGLMNVAPDTEGSRGEAEIQPPCPGVFGMATRQDDYLCITSMLASPSAVSFERQVAMMLFVTLYWYFDNIHPARSTKSPAAKKTPIEGQPYDEWRVNIQRDGALKDDCLVSMLQQMGLIASLDSLVGTAESPAQDKLFVASRMFWQLRNELFLYRIRGDAAQAAVYSSSSQLSVFRQPPPLMYTTTNGIRHSVRPKPPRMGELFYTRFSRHVNAYISFRVASISPTPVAYKGPTGPEPASNAHLRDMSDTALIKMWMAKPRVSHFWGEYTDDFLNSALSDPHSIPVIGMWDGVPFGFFQIYWVKEDILGQHVGGEVARDFDRGLHVFIGEEWARGRVPCWLNSLAHWCLLDDSRTMSVCLEPRMDNENFIRHLRNNMFHQERLVSFPHKQAWMVRLRREMWEAPEIW